MQHETLGEITRDTDDSAGIAHISYGGRTIEVQMIPDGDPFGATVHLAARAVQELEELDATAKRIASAELTATYNDGWNEYEETLADGTSRSVSNPHLSESEFAKKLTLQAVHATGAAMLEFLYYDAGMFWGHCVIVTSFDGLGFTNSNAQILG